jgi:hypothetical protein
MSRHFIQAIPKNRLRPTTRLTVTQRFSTSPTCRISGLAKGIGAVSFAESSSV